MSEDVIGFRGSPVLQRDSVWCCCCLPLMCAIMCALHLTERPCKPANWEVHAYIRQSEVAKSGLRKTNRQISRSVLTTYLHISASEAGRLQENAHHLHISMID